MFKLPDIFPATAAPGWPIIVQPAARDTDGNFTQPPVVLPAPTRADEDQATGDVSWTYSRALPLTLIPLLARNVQQQRNRDGTYAVIADIGAVLVQVSYQSGSNPEPRPPVTVVGVLTLPSLGSESVRYSQTLTLTRCDVLYTRDGGRQQP